MGSLDHYYLAFNCLHKLRNSVILAIIEYFDYDAAAAWQKSKLWADIIEISHTMHEQIQAQIGSIDPDKLYEEYLASGFSLTCFCDEDYPKSLREIYKQIDELEKTEIEEFGYTQYKELFIYVLMGALALLLLELLMANTFLMRLP